VCGSTGAETGQGRAINCFAAESCDPMCPHFYTVTQICQQQWPVQMFQRLVKQNTCVLGQHRVTVMKGQSFLTYKDATNHATIENVGGMLEK